MVLHHKFRLVHICGKVMYTEHQKKNLINSSECHSLKSTILKFDDLLDADKLLHSLLSTSKNKMLVLSKGRKMR